MRTGARGPEVGKHGRRRESDGGGGRGPRGGGGDGDTRLPVKRFGAPEAGGGCESATGNTRGVSPPGPLRATKAVPRHPGSRLAPVSPSKTPHLAGELGARHRRRRGPRRPHTLAVPHARARPPTPASSGPRGAPPWGAAARPNVGTAATPARREAGLGKRPDAKGRVGSSGEEASRKTGAPEYKGAGGATEDSQGRAEDTGGPPGKRTGIPPPHTRAAPRRPGRRPASGTLPRAWPLPDPLHWGAPARPSRRRGDPPNGVCLSLSPAARSQLRKPTPRGNDPPERDGPNPCPRGAHRPRLGTGAGGEPLDAEKREAAEAEPPRPTPRRAARLSATRARSNAAGKTAPGMPGPGPCVTLPRLGGGRRGPR